MWLPFPFPLSPINSLAFRGLDIPSVDIVINFDVPTHSKDYIHRVGRTARAGRAGKSVTLVTQYDVELIQRIEHMIGKQMDLWDTDKEEIALLRERVNEAARLAAKELRDKGIKGGEGSSNRQRKRSRTANAGDERDLDDDRVEAGMPKRKVCIRNHQNSANTNPFTSETLSRIAKHTSSL